MNSAMTRASLLSGLLLHEVAGALDCRVFLALGPGNRFLEHDVAAT